MATKILIANRGEIAIRIIRACRELGISTVAIYSVADKNCLHVRLADEAYCIGPAAPKDSYLNIPAIIAAAELSGATAIHPGYGFLAENPVFCEICEATGILFIGPSVENIRTMGNKNEARKMAVSQGIPVVPGSVDTIGSNESMQQFAAEIGYPLIIKAVAGGGGKGMRIVESESQLIENFNMATSEAQAAFGDGRIYGERYIQNPRHIEIQILSDQHGAAVHLGERDCSIQRRHQKLIEESPSPFLDTQIRTEMGAAAIQLCKALKYQGAGTVEFLVDDQKRFYFMEMNTRIQVEHPVTEWVTGIDLIKQQILIAITGKLELTQSDIIQRGAAIELRINAEDPAKQFAPCPGTVALFLPPGGFGVRVDSHVYPGYTIPPYYDSLLAKLVVWGEDRSDCIARARRSLDEFVLDGVATTISFHQSVLQTPEFVNGTYTTRFLEHYIEKMA